MEQNRNRYRLHGSVMVTGNATIERIADIQKGW